MFRHIIISACLVAMTATVWAQPMAPQQQQTAPAPQQRMELLKKLQQQEEDGAAETEDASLRASYLDTLRALGYYDLLAKQYARQAEQEPDSVALWRACAEAWLLVGPAGVQPAYDAFQRVLSLDENDIEARAGLAFLLHREGRHEDARQYYDEVMKRQPEHVRARLGLAALWAREGKVAECSEALDAIGAAAQPFDVETRLMLRKALYDFEQHGGWFEDAAPNHHAYARLLYRAGRIMDAMLAAHRAVNLAPEDYESWNFIAAMQAQLGNLDQARQAYDKSLEAQPDQPVIRASRDHILQELNARPGAPTR